MPLNANRAACAREGRSRGGMCAVAAPAMVDREGWGARRIILCQSLASLSVECGCACRRTAQARPKHHTTTCAVCTCSWRNT